MNFNQIKKLIKEALKELELEVLTEEPEISEEDLKEVLSIGKEKLLIKFGIDPQEFFEYEEGLKEIGKAKGKKNKEELNQLLKEQEERIVSKIPEIPKQLPPQIINKKEIVERTIKEIIKEKPINVTKVIKETIREVDNSKVDELRSDLTFLQESFHNIKIPEPVDLESFRLVINKDSADIANKLWGQMPNFRALAMGLRGDIDEIKNKFSNFESDPLSLHLDQTTPQTVTGGIPTFVEGIYLGDNTVSLTKDGSGNLTFVDAITGTKTLAQLAAGGGGVTDHSLLSNLNWAAAGHTIDSEFEVGAYDVLLAEIGTPANPSANGLKVYAKDVAGVTKLHTLDSAGTETELGAGGAGATDLPDLTDVDDALEYTSGFVLQADGSQYYGAQLSHTLLSDIGGLTHDDLDAHVNSDTTTHALSTNLLHSTGAESKAGLLTFSDTLPQSTVVPSADADFVNKLYADSIAAGLEVKMACRVATTAAGTLASDFENGDTIDDVVLATGNRILIKNQADATTNGIYTVNVSGAPTRATDYDATSEVQEGTFTSILEGTTNANKQFVQITKDPVLDTNDLVFSQLSAAQVYSASGEGLELSANQFSLELDGATLSKSADGLKLAAGFGAANQFLAMDAAGTAQEYKTLTQGSNITIDNSVAGVTTISSSLSGSPDFTYSDITLHSHPASSFTYTNLPIAETAASSYLRRKVDLTGAVQFRIVVNQAVAGYAGSKFRLKYSTNNSTFNNIDAGSGGDLDVGTGTGVKTGTWTDVVAGAKQDVWLQIYGVAGDGIVDPQFRQVTIQIKYNSTIVDGSASDIVHWEVPIMAHSTSNSVWTNMPLALTEFMNTQYSTRRKVNLQNVTHYRIVVNQAVAGYAGADFNVQYSTNGSTFQALDTAGAGELDVGTGVGVKYGAWATLVDAGKGDVWIRLVGKDGNGVVDPSWRYIAIQFKEYTYGQGVAGNDTEILFNDAGSTGADSRFIYDKTTNEVQGTFGLLTTGYIYGNGIFSRTFGDDGSGTLDAAYVAFTNSDDTQERIGYMSFETTDQSFNWAANDSENNLIDLNFNILGQVNAPLFNGDVTSGGQTFGMLGNEYSYHDATDMDDAGRTSDYDGRYLYVGTYVAETSECTFRIYDMIDPLVPVLVSPTTITGLPASSIKGIRYFDNHVYITYDDSGANGFRIVDVTNRAAPVTEGGSGLTTLQALGGGATLDLDTVNLIAYVMGSTSLYSIDVSDTTTPVILDEIENLYSGAWTCAYSAGYVYVGGRDGNATGNTLHIVDVSTPAAMSEVTPTAALDLKEGMWTLKIEGNYVYVAAGGSFTKSDNPKFYIINVTDKENPVISSSLRISLTPSSYLRKSGDFVYMTNWASSGTDNLFVINVHDVTNPYIVSSREINIYPVNLYPIDNGRYLSVLFAPIPRAGVNYFGVLESKGFEGHEAKFDFLEVDTDTNTSLITDTVDIDLSALVEGLSLTIPIIEGNAYSSMPEAISLPYAVGFYDKAVIFDKSETGEFGLSFSTLDFSSNADFLYNTAGYFSMNANLKLFDGDSTYYKLTTGTLNIANIPTSSSGLSSGDVWSNGGVLTIVP